MRATGFILVLLVIPAVAGAGEAFVRLEHGLVSATFEAATAAEALEAVRRATGMAVVGSAPIGRGPITLRVDRVPLERFLRRMLEVLGLSGFALVYAPDGQAERLMVLAEATDAGGPSTPTAPAGAVDEAPEPEPLAAVPHARPGQDPVTLLVRQAEAASMNFGAPGQVVVVDSPPVARARTARCGGAPGDYPVHTAIVLDGAKTYLTSMIVCAARGLTPGERLSPAPAPAPPTANRRPLAGNRRQVPARTP